IAANVQYIPPPPQQHTFAGQTVPKIEPVTVSAAQLSLCIVNEDEATRVEQSPLAAPAKSRKRAPTEPLLWQ
ncbi:MAG TPA: hypothetical protein DHV65_04565, partial [Ktedonobacter sp.]|nr:hypothetical protein [Ktedonobacter sp.]